VVNGFALARRARELRPGLPVVYTSGRDQTDGMTALAVEGAVFLAKPYSRVQLVTALSASLGSAPAGGKQRRQRKSRTVQNHSKHE
jgi:DNA-binding response OmpR family regulator